MNKNENTAPEQDLITQKLKSLYNSVQDEEIPERFLQMLEQLDQAEEAANKSGKDTSSE